MKHSIPSHRVPAFPRLFWIPLIVAASAALLFWLGDAASAETGRGTTGVATVWDLVEPEDLTTATQDDDATAFREDEAGFSAHHRVPDHSEGDGQDDLRPRLNVTSITESLLKDPDESNSNRRHAGRHVDSGGNFGIIELPMAATQNFGPTVPPRPVTVYYDDRGWVVAYLPPNAPAAGVWRYDTANQPANNLQQNLLMLAINEVLTAARQDVPEIANADDSAVGYYHWQHPKHNAFVLFSHTSNGGESEPIRFVVPPTIQDIRASATVLDTTDATPAEDGASLYVRPNLDGEPVAETSGESRMAVEKFDLARPDLTATSLHEVTVAVDDGATAAGAVMLLYTKPGS